MPHTCAYMVGINTRKEREEKREKVSAKRFRRSRPLTFWAALYASAFEVVDVVDDDRKGIYMIPSTPTWHTSSPICYSPHSYINDISIYDLWNWLFLMCFQRSFRSHWHTDNRIYVLEASSRSFFVWVCAPKNRKLLKIYYSCVFIQNMCV